MEEACACMLALVRLVPDPRCPRGKFLNPRFSTVEQLPGPFLNP